MKAHLSIGFLVTLGLLFLVGLYFTFAAVQGDYGVFKRGDLEAQELELTQRLAALNQGIAQMENLTKRLSESYLDLDLLDQQARDVLGLVRADEIVIQ